MKIISWNVAGIRAILKRENLQPLIKSENPDVICFQEYYYDNNKEFITRELIIKELGFEYFHESFTNESKNSSKFGLATFSRFPIVNKQELEFKILESIKLKAGIIKCETGPKAPILFDTIKEGEDYIQKFKKN